MKTLTSDCRATLLIIQVRHHMNLFSSLAAVENSFQSALEFERNGDSPNAISRLNSAKERLNRLIEERENTFEKLKTTFGGSQIHSDHHDLGFMTSREEALKLDRYVYMLENLIKDYGEKNGLDGFYDKLESRPMIPIGN